MTQQEGRGVVPIQLPAVPNFDFDFAKVEE